MRRFLHYALLLAASGCTSFLSLPATAQTRDAKGRLAYPATFFAQFSPSNAYEIVQRVPGFTLDAGDGSVRGFGQAAGNVVINGQRPSSKSDTLDTILARIPASRVLRIEVGPGEPYGAEYSSKPQVLNLVLTDAAGLAGTVEGAVRRDFTGHIFPGGSASVLLKKGPSTFKASASVSNETTSEEGYDILTARPAGTRLEYRRKVNHFQQPISTLSSSWDYDGGTNRLAHLNLRYSLDRVSLTQNNDVFPALGPQRDDLLTQRYHDRDFELGGDVTRPFIGGGLKLIGLATRRHRLDKDVSLYRVGATAIGGDAQTLEDQLDETLFRLVWTRAKLAGWTVEAGVEGVLNRLDSNVELVSLDALGARSRVELPIDQAVVKEYRGEGFINAGRDLRANLRMDLGLTYEASRLTVSGDAHARRVLTFPKPKASVDWRPKGGWHVQASLERTVSQLQFGDFVSTAQISSGQVSGGNAELIPQRSWDLLTTLEHPILGDGQIKIDLGYDWVSKVQDRVPVTGGFDAPGNLGSGREIIARAKLDLPLVRFGIKGGRLTLYGSYLSTSVRDPYTGRDRPFSNNNLFYGSVDFRQDLGHYAWGFSLEGFTPSTSYRRVELDRSQRQVPYVSAFAEYRLSARTTLIATLINLTSASGSRRRTFFNPDRTSATAVLYELRHRNQHIRPEIKIKHSFG